MSDSIDTIGQEALNHLGLKHAARERALPKARSAIRNCANSIRAVHRQEFEKADALIEQTRELLREITESLRDHPDIYYAGFVQDAQKEYTEAVTFAALTRQRPLPDANALTVGWAPYLNGLGEAVGELRRYILDQLRRSNFADCETFLQYMDDIYALLTTVDYPDAVTAGLRRTTDATRGILERTRSDLTLALNQLQLQQAMQKLQQELQKNLVNKAIL